MREKAEVQFRTDTLQMMMPGVVTSQKPEDQLTEKDIAKVMFSKYIVVNNEGGHQGKDIEDEEKYEKSMRIGAKVAEHAADHGSIALVNEEEPEIYIYKRKEDGNFYHTVTHHKPAIKEIKWDYLNHEELMEDE